MAADARLEELAPADPRIVRGGGEAGERSGPSRWDPDALMARAHGENFPVASRLLGAGLREHLLALYGFARLTDELGDSFEGDRAAALDWLERELDLAYQGAAGHPLLVALTPTLEACSLPREPFLRLIAANRLDQRRSRYESLDELLDYCALSANPVGELVLGVLGLATPERVALSDLICSGLQIAEHLQDVAEDRRNGRIYLPQRDLARFGVAASELDARTPSPALRELLAFEVDRTRAMLLRGAPLIATLPPRARLAVAAYVAGGLAALDAIEAAHYEVLAGAPRATHAERLRVTLALLANTPGARRSHRPTGQDPAGEAVDAAYRACERITRREARNFHYGIRLLPAPKRRAMCAVYAFARRVDDIGDGPLAPAEKLARLDVLAADLERIGPSPARALPEAAERAADGALAADPVLTALADAQRRFGLPLDALSELLEGVRMDICDVRYERFDQLLVYCRRVAGGIGRLCLAIFGVEDGRAAGWASTAADELGVALQLTNILRDLREDARRGRLYLPREDLVRFGLAGAEDPPERALELFAGAVPEEQLRALIEFEAERARQWFARGMSLLEQLDRRSAACVLAMAGIYSRLLERIAEQPAGALEARVSLPASEKARVALGGLLGAGA